MSQLTKQWHTTPMRVLVFGTFDGLHPGHRSFLDTAQERGELWIVVARDKNVAHIKGVLPKEKEGSRRRTIEKAYPSAHVQLGDQEDYKKPLEDIQPDLILLGYDQRLPPGLSLEDLPCPIERLTAFEPGQHKSSLQGL